MAVTGHEIGHYGLRHKWRELMSRAVIAMLAFFCADRSYAWLTHVHGSRAPLESPESLAVVLLMVSVFGALEVRRRADAQDVVRRAADACVGA